MYMYIMKFKNNNCMIHSNQPAKAQKSLEYKFAKKKGTCAFGCEIAIVIVITDRRNTYVVENDLHTVLTG